MSLVIIVASGEAFARYYFGLGTPPLSITHPKIEYMYKPNQDTYRFGNHFTVNQYGMRSKSFSPMKNYGEYRIMVYGDSVINGGSQTDQSALATTVLEDRLSRRTNRTVLVGNISAGSWGPGNWLAYAKEFGFFGADVIALVISSHDYEDNPTFEKLNENTHPTKRPISAFLEGIARYLPRRLPQRGVDIKSTNRPDRSTGRSREQEAQKGLSDLRRFLELAKHNAPKVLVLQHWEKLEIQRGFANPGNLRIKAVCERIGIIPISLEAYFHRSMAGGTDPYRDNIHPNEVGQQLIAEAIIAALGF